MIGRVGKMFRDLRLDNFQSRLNPLEGLFCKRMAILVWVKLFGQFSVKLTEGGLGHRFHALPYNIFGSIYKLVDQKNLVYFSLLSFCLSFLQI